METTTPRIQLSTSALVEGALSAKKSILIWVRPESKDDERAMYVQSRLPQTSCNRFLEF